MFSRYLALSSKDLATLIGGTSVAGLVVPTGRLLGELRFELQRRRDAANALRENYHTQVGARPLEVQLYEIHRGPAPE